MNGSSQLPQYTFDPATQQYRLMTPTQQTREQQKRSGLGGLYDAGGSGSMGSQSPAGFGMMGPGMAEMGVGAQNMGLALSGVPSIAAQVASAVASGIGNAMMNSQVSPVANPSPIISTPIAPNPTQTLAAMNAASGGDGDDDGPEGDVSIGALSTEGFADAADAAAAAAGDAAAAAGDAGADGGGGGDGGGGDGGGGDGGGSAAGSAGTGDGEREGGMIYQKRYAEGGLASAAQHVQNQGRGEDKVLVHMTPGEVRGLQAIAMQHGGSLTINPKTGLVEANFLKSILPVVAGAALAPFTGGASMAALLVGGGTALMTGSLEKGLMAGLGAFGGASLAGSLSAAGAATTAGKTVTPGLAGTVPVTAQPVVGAAPMATSSYVPSVSTLAPTASTTAPVTFSNMGSGIKALGTEAGRAEFMRAAGDTKGLITKAGLAAAPMMFSAEEPDTGGKKPQEYIRPYGFDFKPSAETDPNFRFRTGEKGESTAEQRYFNPTFTPMGVYKAGTEPGPSFYGTPTADQYALYSGPRQGGITDVIPEGQLGSGFQKFVPQLNQFTQGRIDAITGPSSQGRFAAGGVAGLGKGGLRDGAFIVPADVVAHLGNGSNDAGQKLLARGLGARPIKGKGDGMSDSIPTSIEGKQPAKVADGEAYIPPEVVKKVGSKRLYDMMAKIRKARTNTTRQAPEVDPRKFMPA
jgi:hypothetical protein